MVYQDIKAAFDSVDRHALWEALHSRGIPDVLTDLIAALHENTGAAIRVGKNKSARLETTSGVRRGCILAPALFCVAIDCILNHMTARPSINIGSSSFSDLVYADDTAFFVKDATNATDCLSSFSHSFNVRPPHLVAKNQTAVCRLRFWTESSSQLRINDEDESNCSKISFDHFSHQ